MRTIAASLVLVATVSLAACEVKDSDDAPAAAPAATQPAASTDNTESGNSVEIRTNNDTVKVGDQGTQVKVDVDN